MFLRRPARVLALWGALALMGTARAGTATTRESLDRLEEVLELRLEDGTFTAAQVTPAILVSAQPRLEESQSWFATAAIEVLVRSFGSSGLRFCEACMAPRVFVEDGSLRFQSGPIGLDEVTRLDEQSRGSAAAARSAIWIDEHPGGVSIRIVDLGTARVIFAQNIDPDLQENTNSERMYTLSEELERRARGDSLTQAFVDLTLYPGQHFSVDWTEQWGPTNHKLSGVTLSLYDPVIGVGAAHYRCLEVLDALAGGKLILSLPTALVRAVGDSGDLGDVIDPMLTLVGVVRVPFGRSNYGAILTASTNGEIGIGLSLMNISLLPVIP